MRGLPGTLAPMYQELARGCRVMLPQSATCWFHPASAVGVGSMVSKPWSRRSARQSAIHSTCCSIDTDMLESTDGLPGPVMVKRLGNPTVVRPRYVEGPSAHL